MPITNLKKNVYMKKLTENLTKPKSGTIFNR